MAVEFRCPQCGRLLRVPDDAVGRQAQCPQCQSVTTVTVPSAEPSSFPALDVPLSSAPPPPAKLNMPLSWPEQGAGGPTASNPFQSPSGNWGQPQVAPVNRQWALERVVPVATALIVSSSLGMLSSVGFMLMALIGMAADQKNPANDLPPAVMLLIVVGVYVVVPCALALVVLNGALKMRRLQSYTWAMAGAIVALVPCQACCILSIPFGIWALVVLSDTSIRAAFDS